MQYQQRILLAQTAFLSHSLPPALDHGIPRRVASILVLEDHNYMPLD